MTPESIPSGALKVAELLNEARVEGDARYTLRTSAVAFTKGAEFALNLARRDLASPSPATGARCGWKDCPHGDECVHAALSSAKREAEPLTRKQAIALWGNRSDGPSNGEIAAFARAVEAAHGITAASQVEPEDKHG